MLDLSGRAVLNLALIESAYPLPAIARLKEYETHLDAMEASNFAALKRDNERLSRLLGEKHVDKLYELLAARRPWTNV
jgi:hypothetical protein